MATRSSSKFNLDLTDLGERIASQFRGLNTNDPGTWPPLPKILACLGLAALVLVLGWFLWLTNYRDELINAEAEEEKLKQEYRQKLTQAVNLEELRKQKELVTQYVRQLEKQLPSKAEMDALLSDINQSGIGRGLTFELFKPGAFEPKNYYAELPINIKVNGGYHELASFASDLANLSRIVTLNNINVQTNKEGKLVMETVAKTFRYLDADEVAAQRAAEAKAKQGAGKSGQSAGQKK
jgi:type IV pilus assembly protein PilO